MAFVLAYGSSRALFARPARPPFAPPPPDITGPLRHEMLARLGRIAFIQRPEYGMHGTNATMLAHRTARKSAICLYDPLRPDALPKILYETADGFIFDMSPSYDGRKLVFSHKTRNDEPFHIWEINSDGSGLRQLTRGNYHDVSPAYLPDGRIVFTSTRVESYSLCQNFLAAALYIMEADGQNIRRLEYSTLCDTSPSVLSDGTILYGRWEYNDKNIFCTQALWTVNPDGSRVQLFYGNTLTVPNAMYGGKQIPGTSKVVFTMAAHHHPPIGAIGVIDRSLGRENVAGLVNITPEVPYVPTAGQTWRDTNWGLGDIYYPWAYTDPWPVDDQVCLVSYAGPNDRRHKLYVMDYRGAKTLLYADKAQSCFNAVSLKDRDRPAVFPGSPPPRASGEGTFILQDIYQGLLDAGVQRGQVAFLRIMSQLPKKYNTEGRRYLDEYPTIGRGTYYVKYNYGTVPVTPEGSAYFKAPAGVELYFQALDKDGKEIRRMGTLTQLVDGETQSCVGCHESRSASPSNASPALLQRLASRPDPITPPSWGAGTVDYVRLVQPVLDQYCASCHSGKTPQGRIDLSGDRTRFFCMSYEAMFGPKPWVDAYHLNPGPTGNFPALGSGSWTSRLTRLLESDHYKVKLDPQSRSRIYTWIDANAPYYGTWDMTRPHSRGGRDAWCVPSENGIPLLAPWVGRLHTFLAANCYSCHKTALADEDDSKPVNWPFPPTAINLTHPENSLLLNAHLCKAAGGYEMTGVRRGNKAPPLFKATSDKLYGELLDILKDAAKNLADHPREDMPGARHIPQERNFGKVF